MLYIIFIFLFGVFGKRILIISDIHLEPGLKQKFFKYDNDTNFFSFEVKK